MKILSSNNVEIFRHFGSSRFRTLSIEHKVAGNGAELLELANTFVPDIVLIDATLSDANGYEICRTIKENGKLEKTHVILLMSRILTRNQLDQVAQSSCDDVLALPIHGDDFYHHLAHVAHLPTRNNYRVPCWLTSAFSSSGDKIGGSVVNASPQGLGIEVDKAVAVGTKVSIEFTSNGNALPIVQADVVWASTTPNRTSQLGLRLAGELPISVRVLLERVSQFDVVLGDSQTAGAVTVRVQGALTEATQFAGLVEKIKSFSVVDFDMAGVRYLSSAGVKEWCNFLAELGDKKYWFRRCSLAFVAQAAMVPSVLRNGQVRSFETPYYCKACAKDEVRLLEADLILQEDDDFIPPELSCQSCNGMLEFDDIPSRYFAFLSKS